MYVPKWWKFVTRIPRLAGEHDEFKFGCYSKAGGGVVRYIIISVMDFTFTLAPAQIGRCGNKIY